MIGRYSVPIVELKYHGKEVQNITPRNRPTSRSHEKKDQRKNELQL
jgi:hypothetical protein